jgi:hypothetical protein
VQPNAGGTQGYDGYAYAVDNPVTVSDPTGHGIAEVFGILARVFGCILHGEGRHRLQRESAKSGALRIVVKPRRRWLGW